MSLGTLAPRRARAVLATIAGAALLLSACSSGDDSDPDSTTSPNGEQADVAVEGDWPRTVEHDAGETEIPEAPITIVSTSITITGTLLAMDVPVAASAATGVGPLTDENGFFAQWADVAVERGVEVLYPNLELDLEAVDALAPDLIIGSVTGADSTVDAYDQLSEIAPTILLDYGSNTWQQLAVTLGEATGLEQNATDVVEEFDAFLTESAAAITLPDQPVTTVAYNGADGGGIFSDTSSQAAIMTGLGFEYAAGPEDLADEVRTDVTFYTAENLPSALAEPQTVFIISGGDEDTDAFLADSLLANTPAVVAGNVLPLGPTSFRIDFYSGTQAVEAIIAAFGA
ncbi:Fe2+-enterobactin ABC transporter substrate-binding protein [Occultella kanbiaonis]|uniref:Fe2+-enterobactin ABC transporter substrate-binding protein n=1 Tax=Occultella kanbiaonis TaxID=2675754 RepID=UPI0012B7D12E|nr:Fe2+-enterobactin ABC transporter substrate-binding protein [Occultella kanbiaonis]